MAAVAFANETWESEHDGAPQTSAKENPSVPIITHAAQYQAGLDSQQEYTKLLFSKATHLLEERTDSWYRPCLGAWSVICKRILTIRSWKKVWTGFRICLQLYV